MQGKKNSHRRSRSVDDAELINFRCYFAKDGKEYLQRLIMHVFSYCFAH